MSSVNRESEPDFNREYQIYFNKIHNCCFFFTYGACQEQGNQILVKFERNMHLKEIL